MSSIIPEGTAKDPDSASGFVATSKISAWSLVALSLHFL